MTCNATALACSEAHVDCIHEKKSPPCMCTSQYSDCLEQAECLHSDLRRELFGLCVKDGCSESQCGFLPGVDAGVFPCLDYHSTACRDSFLECNALWTADMNGCSCTRELMQCLVNAGCAMDDGVLTEMAGMCVSAGCSAQQCGICEDRCNATQATCNNDFYTCEQIATSKAQKCACHKASYECAGDCNGPDALLEHAQLCLMIGCTRDECGMPADMPLVNCSFKKMQCAANLQACATKPNRFANDACYQNYASQKDHGRYGRDACNSKYKGGLPGCIYNSKSDSCFESDGCHCTKDYVDCVKTHGCPVTDQFDISIAEECAADGCAPQDCGFPAYLYLDGYCGNIADSCSKSYHQCETVRRNVAFEVKADLVQCSGCLKNYFVCMASHNCTSPEDHMRHQSLCLAESCTPEECGFSNILGEVFCSV